MVNVEEIQQFKNGENTWKSPNVESTQLCEDKTDTKKHRKNARCFNKITSTQVVIKDCTCTVYLSL